MSSPLKVDINQHIPFIIALRQNSCTTV